MVKFEVFFVRRDKLSILDITVFPLVKRGAFMKRRLKNFMRWPARLGLF